MGTVIPQLYIVHEFQGVHSSMFLVVVIIYVFQCVLGKQ